eukprot:11504026-Karenia_brevis.AAC.1
MHRNEASKAFFWTWLTAWPLDLLLCQQTSRALFLIWVVAVHNNAVRKITDSLVAGSAWDDMFCIPFCSISSRWIRAYASVSGR